MSNSYDTKAVQRFLSKVEKSSRPDGCWLWQGSRDRKGYGRLWYRGRAIQAHRFGYFTKSGQHLPDSLFGCHKCDNPSCVNPDHIFPGTPSENRFDMHRKGRENLPAQHGSHNHRSKLSPEQVKAIREEYARGGVFYRQLADKYGVHLENIRKIVKGLSWKNTGAPERTRTTDLTDVNGAL